LLEVGARVSVRSGMRIRFGRSLLTVMSATFVSVAVVSAACSRRKAGGLDEAAIQSAGIDPDAPPVNGKVFGAAQQDCNRGDAHGCFALGSAFLTGLAETSKDEARSTRLFWKACAGNDATSCALLGHAFCDGVGGTKQDVTVAKKWYAKACALGHEACKTRRAREVTSGAAGLGA
jgi:hypothetical protein